MAGSVAQAAVERAIHAVRREFFLPAEERRRAREDIPLPIGFAQTISQPSLVATMTEQLAPAAHSRVLEIGTGSGYQTAILAEIAEQVFTIERIPGLAASARRCLGELRYRNISFRLGDGALGWPEAAPFDRIMVTAAARTIPPELLRQLAPAGILVAPAGPNPEEQVLLRIEKSADGQLHERELCAVRFVPLVTSTQP
jgi:protein-L-isoaspartate(D-aspartate) O-methyltransferase